MRQKNNKKAPLKSQTKSQTIQKTLGALAIAVGCFRFYQMSSWLFQGRWPLDYDGFYYLVELKHRLETSSGYYTASFHPFFSVVTWILRIGGWSPAQAYPWLVWIAFVLFGFGLLRPFIKKNFAICSFLFLLFFGSHYAFFGFYGFLKQGWGMAMVSLGGAFSVFAFAFHPSSALCAGVAFFRERKMSPPVLAGLGALTLFLSWKLFPSISFFNPFTFLTTHQLSASEFFEVLFLFFIVLGSLVFLRGKSDSWMKFFGVLSLVGFLPFWGAESWRMLITSFLISLVFIRRFMEKYSTQVEIFVPKFLVALLLGVMVFPAEIHPLGPTLLVEPIEEMAPALKAWIPPHSFILAPHGLQFRLTYFLDRSSGQTLPSHFNAASTPLFELHRVENRENCRYPQCVSLTEHWEIFRH